MRKNIRFRIVPEITFAIGSKNEGIMREKISFELLLHDDVRKLLDNFAALMRVQVVFFAADGRILRRGRYHANSDFCRIMQESYFGVEMCRRLDAEKQRECRERGEIVCYRCHAGLQEMISPVVIYGQVAGFVLIGQFRLSDTPPPFLRDADALRAYYELPRIAENELGNLVDMLKMLIDYIVSKELVGFAGDLRFHRINQYLDRHYAGEVTLKQLARHLACSESALTHYLHDEHRTSFKKLLTAKRLAAAEALMKSRPELSIAEVAHQVGYRDQCYFSRVYRAERHRSPGEGRRFAGSGNGEE